MRKPTQSKDGRWSPQLIRVGDRRTTVRLEPIVWESLHDIARYYGISTAELIERIDRLRPEGDNLSSAIRVYVIKFYRAASRL
jgi:predicted DNA-binding ribbon-helix-helix protein